MSNKNSFAFYSLWEEINNEGFNSVESHRIKTEEVPYNIDKNRVCANFALTANNVKTYNTELYI